MQNVFIALYIVTSLWAFFSIILYGNRPARSISWIIITIVLPFIGVFFYILFGINRKRFKFFSLNFNAKRKLYSLNHSSKTIDEFAHKFNADKYGAVGKLLQKSSGFPAVDGNKITLLMDGKSNFDAIFEAFSKAEKFIHIQYYILEEGELLDKLLALFQEKIKKGVEIRILYDAFGSYGWKNKSVKKLKQLGAEIHPILPLKIGTILSTLNYRNHRKIAIVDGVVGFTGGMNVSDKYIKKKTRLGIWDDLHLKLEGAIVDHLHRVFIKDYFFANNNTLISSKKYLPNQSKKGDSLVQLITGGPDHNYLSILHQYTMMINTAQKSIFIENPYFIPNKSLLEALKMAVLRGVDVKIMVPKNNDSKIAKYSMFGNFEDLLKTGANIYILKDRFSHSKLMIVDEEIASVGSGNFDFRSFEHNYEVNTLMYDTAIAKELAKDFIKNIDDCNILDYNSFVNRSLKTKLLEGFSKILSPLL
ncbi:cardiolipin synthase [Tenacibaculum sp. IB213877]|uniref:cardiolipin synthase n=1 Tax=Tenacibaculum sp. IB213877 TaxID=3097351 RepID=UPI002A59AC00|nr:cardiolipin synthase [Tenacibaculum sp. IB213877]MDY0779526.1 cardiolipin synthase [Tenacibaculum sp. IB213877]